ncbi:hypothetical protein BY996DRAFT_6541901 [Phakopsora pachyrhizi]|nr:hypothetical protein BY996DRAFT_6541901 [Phakopsora pachyrhizi]
MLYLLRRVFVQIARGLMVVWVGERDKEKHMELRITEKELLFAKYEKDKELEVRMLMADKDFEAIKFKEKNALLCAVVESSRSVEEITEISKILFNI